MSGERDAAADGADPEPDRRADPEPDRRADPEPDRRADPEPTDRIRELAARASREKRAFEAPADPPDEAAALAYLREGFAPAVWVYVEGRTGGRRAAFSADGLDALEGAINDWLELYAACHGVALDASFTARTAAELLLETRDVRDTAQLLTWVPGR